MAEGQERGDNPPSLPRRPKKEGPSPLFPGQTSDSGTDEGKESQGCENSQSELEGADKSFAELELVPTDRRDVNPAVIHGLVKVCSPGSCLHTIAQGDAVLADTRDVDLAVLHGRAKIFPHFSFWWVRSVAVSGDIMQERKSKQILVVQIICTWSSASDVDILHACRICLNWPQPFDHEELENKDCRKRAFVSIAPNFPEGSVEGSMKRGLEPPNPGDHVHMDCSRRSFTSNSCRMCRSC